MFSKFVIRFAAWFALVICLGAASEAVAASVHLTWQASSSPSVTGYNIYYGPESGGYSAMLSTGVTTQLDVDDLAEGVTYYFTVTAFNGSGQESDPSNEAAYEIDGLAPPPGTPFVEYIFPDHAITLGWIPSPSSGVRGYQVHYGTQSGLYDQVITVVSNTAVDIGNLADGVTYYFTVAATAGPGEISAWTPESAYTISQLAPPPTAPTVVRQLVDEGVTLFWPDSPSLDVAGYKVYYGTTSGVYDQSFNVANTGPVDVNGLVDGVTYFFAVTTLDHMGQESSLSAEAAFAFEPTAAAAPPVLLTLAHVPQAGFPHVFTLTATGPVPSSWAVEGSVDLKTWQTLAVGADTDVNVAVVVTEKPALFFRLNSKYEDLALELAVPVNDPFPNTLVVSTTATVPEDWTLEGSENLADWSPLVAGNFTPVNVAIVNSPTPELFFRLKGGN